MHGSVHLSLRTGTRASAIYADRTGKAALRVRGRGHADESSPTARGPTTHTASNSRKQAISPNSRQHAVLLNFS